MSHSSGVKFKSGWNSLTEYLVEISVGFGSLLYLAFACVIGFSQMPGRYCLRGALCGSRTASHLGKLSLLWV